MRKLASSFLFELDLIIHFFKYPRFSSIFINSMKIEIIEQQTLSLLKIKYQKI
jgi:hypothetical protein